MQQRYMYPLQRIILLAFRCYLPLLLRSIREVVLSLPSDTDLLPGHSMPTTVAAERERYL